MVIGLGVVIYISNQGTDGEGQALTIMIVFILLALIAAGVYITYLVLAYKKTQISAAQALAKEKIELQEFQTAEYTTLAIASQTGQVREATATLHRSESKNENINRNYNQNSNLYGTLTNAPSGVFGPPPTPPVPPPGIETPRGLFIGRGNTVYSPYTGPATGGVIKATNPVRLYGTEAPVKQYPPTASERRAKLEARLAGPSPIVPPPPGLGPAIGVAPPPGL